MYRLIKNTSRRIRNNYIILTQARNLYEKGTYLNSDIMLGGTYRYTWGEWQKYFYIESKRNKLPCHYFAELIDKDYAIFVGSPFINRSYFLEELADNRIIDEKYRDGIVIAISEDFCFTPMEDRLSIHLADKLISSLCYQYNIPKSNVLYIDDILNSGWEWAVKTNITKFTIEQSRFFDSQNLFRYLKEYDRKGAFN